MPSKLPNKLGALFGSLSGAGIRIGLSKSALAVVRHEGWRKTTTILADHPLAEEAATVPERLAVQCKTILADAACKGLPLAVTLADEWARLFMVTPPQNTGRLQDIQAAAAMRFQALYGELPGDWNLQADWQVRSPFLACAIPRTLLSALQDIAQESKLSLTSVQPHFVAAWNSFHGALGQDGWFGVVHEEYVTLGAMAVLPQRRLEAIRTIPILPESQRPGWLQEQAGRTALQLNIAPPAKLCLVGNRHQFWITQEQQNDAGMIVCNLEKTPPSTTVSAAVLLAHSGKRR